MKKLISLFAVILVAALPAVSSPIPLEGQFIQDKNIRQLTDQQEGANALTDAATVVLDTSKIGNTFSVTLAGNRTFNFTGHQAGRTLVLIVRQDATGSRTVTWDSEVRWAGGTAPTLTTTASRTDVFEFFDTGSRYIGRTVGLAYNEA